MTNDFDFVSNEYGKYKSFERLIDIMCRLNNVEWIKDSTHNSGIVAGASIYKGSLVTTKSYSPALAFHELCHILIVKPEYRHLVDVCTQKSYDTIKKLDPDYKKFINESTTIGLQHIIQTKLNLSSYINGSFFTGDIGRDAVINQSWVDKGATVLNHVIVPESIGYNMELFSNKVSPRIGSRIMINTIENKHFKCDVTPYSIVNSYSFSTYDKSLIKNWFYL